MLGGSVVGERASADQGHGFELWQFFIRPACAVRLSRGWVRVPSAQECRARRCLVGFAKISAGRGAGKTGGVRRCAFCLWFGFFRFGKNPPRDDRKTALLASRVFRAGK